MNWVDGVAVIAAIGAVTMGWRRGLVRRACSLAGVIAALVGVAFAVPRLLPADDVTPSRFIATVGAIWLAALAGSVVGGAAGRALHQLLVRGPLEIVDRIGGSLLGALTVVLAAWLVVPAMNDVPGWPAVAARNSATSSLLDATLGDPPEVFDAIGRALRVGSLPRVFEDLRSPTVDHTPPDHPVNDAVIATLEPSVVRIEGTACRFNVFGSGFFVAPGLVATNAHVVAGTEGVTLHTTDGFEASGVIVYFDADRDVALVATDLDDRPPVRLRSAEEEEVGTVMGFPGGGGLSLEPFFVDSEIDALGRDIYDSEPVRRRILLLAAGLSQGESGGPLVAPSGEVIGMVFAVAPDRPAVAYAIVIDDIRSAMAATRGAEVSSGRCA